MITRIGVIIFTIPCIILLTLYGIELSAATDCQQLGLFYDAYSQQCVETAPAFSILYLRNAFLVISVLIIATNRSLALIVSMVQSKRANHHRYSVAAYWYFFTSPTDSLKAWLSSAEQL